MELLLTEGMVYKKGHFSQQDILIQGGSISKITPHTSYHFSKALEFKNLYIRNVIVKQLDNNISNFL